MELRRAFVESTRTPSSTSIISWRLSLSSIHSSVFDDEEDKENSLVRIPTENHLTAPSNDDISTQGEASISLTSFPFSEIQAFSENSLFAMALENSEESTNTLISS